MTVTDAATADQNPVDQRQRILDHALRLMADAGVHAMSMRSLATACGLNVATIYHYFPSKGALLDAVIAHQDYEGLLVESPPIDPALPTRERMVSLLEWIWQRMGEHDAMWKLLLGESLRGDPQALRSAGELSVAFERAVDRWLDELFPDLPGTSRVNARVVRGLVYGFFIETMPLAPRDRRTYLAQRAIEIASVFVPAPT
jgi:AcrR family transcriptional regulator